MTRFYKNPFSIPLTLFFAVLISYGIFELTTQNYWQLLHGTPQPLIEESLNQGEKLFVDFQNELIDDVSLLRDNVTEIIGNQENRYLIYQALAEQNFWGIILYRNNSPWTWNGFHLLIPPLLDPTDDVEFHTIVQKRNNLSVLIAQSTFIVNEQSYQLVAARKLSHNTNLPIADNANFNLADHPVLNDSYPISYSFSQPPPDESLHSKTLSTTQRDSVGLVYATDTDFSTYQTDYRAEIEEQRFLFQIALFLTLLILFIVYTLNYRNGYSLLYQIILILAFWFLASYYSLAENGVTLFLSDIVEESFQVYLQLTEYVFNSLMLLLICIVTINIFRLFESVKTNRIQIKGSLFALLYGIIQVLLILFFVLSTRQLTVNSAIPLLDLQLLPPISALIFYISGAIFFAAISGISIAMARFLFNYEREKAVLIFVSSLFSFQAASFGIDQLTTLNFFLGWQFLLIFFLYAAFIFTGWLFARYPEIFISMSGFRRMMILLLFTSLSVYFIIWNTTPERANKELQSVANEYLAESESDGEEILRSMLQTLELRLHEISGQEIFENPERAQARFERIVESLVRGKWQNYVMDFHLLRNNGDLISDYSTSIDSPGWTSVFDLNFMIRSHRGEQLRMETNRPIIWDRPGDIGEDYRSFYRGWIPLYSSENPGTIVAWITGLIYQERPDFNKPIRAVLAATTEEDWRKSFYMAEFTGNRVVRSATKGIYTDQPEYNRLSEIERNIAMEDSLAFITTRTTQGSFREILLKVGDRNIIKVSTPKPGFSNHLFSFFRLFLPLFFFGLFVMGLLSICGLRSFHLFSQTKRFQNRLIDGFTLATLLLLTVLIFTTQFAISNQSEKNIERDLTNKLKNLSESIQLSAPDIASDSFEIPLSTIITPLNVDAILYDNVWVSESTTPQIFQQHLIPRILPFNAYEFLFNRERRHILSTVKLGGETLLVGYRTIIDEDNQPIGTVAIPTFTKSPVFTEQLLETTSYLFAIYLAIFLLFTFGALMFTNQLTKPLESIQKGLNKISRGEEKTKIPVTSSDEVGSLAEAYNQMVDKLDEAQKELIKAERESAWKEMAQQVAHEIKNPLTPMKLNLQHLQRQLEANPDDVLKLKPAIETTASHIIEQIESLNKIASDFSKFSKPIRDPLEPTDLKPLIESVSDLYNNDENVTVTVDIQSEHLIANCVGDEIRRVMINLVKNGIEAAEAKQAAIHIEAGSSGDELYIEIKDNGAGIPVDNRKNIFVPNFSTKSSGTGLGLAISKKIIEAHEGDITFQTTPGNGSTFTIRLPRHQPDS